jgi:hypothetical protein
MASGSQQRRKKNQAKIVKRTIKYLASAPDSNVARSVLNKAPDGVFRAISNAALNASQGEVQIPPDLKQTFRRHIKHFDILTDSRRPLAAKRRLILQRGGALPIIVPLLATVLGTVGSEFISRIFRKNDE